MFLRNFPLFFHDFHREIFIKVMESDEGDLIAIFHLLWSQHNLS